MKLCNTIIARVIHTFKINYCSKLLKCRAKWVDPLKINKGSRNPEKTFQGLFHPSIPAWNSGVVTYELACSREHNKGGRSRTGFPRSSPSKWRRPPSADRENPITERQHNGGNYKRFTTLVHRFVIPFEPLPDQTLSTIDNILHLSQTERLSTTSYIEIELTVFRVYNTTGCTGVKWSVN